MKKILLLSLSAAFLSASLQAQTVSKKSCDWGLKMGLNGSNIRVTNGNSGTWKTGLVTGVYFNFKVADKLSIQPEALYSSMGAKNLMSTEETSLRLNYFSIPVLLQYKVTNCFAVVAGPQVDVMIQAKMKNGGGFSKVTDSYKENSFNATGGVTAWPVSCLGFTLRYIYGLNNISKGATELKNQGVQLTAALKL